MSRRRCRACGRGGDRRAVGKVRRCVARGRGCVPPVEALTSRQTVRTSTWSRLSTSGRTGGPRPVMSRCRVSVPDDQQVLMPGLWPWRRSPCRGQGAPMRRPRPWMRPTGRGSRQPADHPHVHLVEALDQRQDRTAGSADEPPVMPGLWPWRRPSSPRPSMRPTGRGSRQPADGSHVHRVEALDQLQDGTAGSGEQVPPT